VKADRESVDRAGDSFEPEAAMFHRILFEMLVQHPAQTLFAISLTNRYQLYVACRLCLRQEAEKVGNNPVILLYHKGRIAELVNQSGVVQRNRAIAIPELAEIGQYLIEIVFCAIRDSHWDAASIFNYVKKYTP